VKRTRNKEDKVAVNYIRNNIHIIPGGSRGY